MTYCTKRRNVQKCSQVAVPDRTPLPCLYITYNEWLRYKAGDWRTVAEVDRLRNGAPVVTVVGQNLEVVTR